MPGRHVTDNQMRLFMNQTRTHTVETAAAKAGFSASTGHRIRRDPRLPSQKAKPRGSRRPDPLGGLFESEVVPLLEANPRLRPLAVFDELLVRHPKLNPNIRRTLERRIRRWRALHGPDREVIFRQDKEPGRLGISDFTHTDTLGVTVAGEAFEHLLYHFRLPWSGFTHVHVVRGGESFRALSKGLQDALWLLGGTPAEHRTDSLSAAFRNLSKDTADDLTARYRSLCRDHGMTPTRNNRGAAHENGAIEGPHGHLKGRIADALALRGSSDFADIDQYRSFIAGIVGRINARNAKAIAAERRTLKALPPRRSDDVEQAGVSVTSSSGFILRGVFQTVPSRLIGHQLRVHIHEDRLDLFLGETHLFELPRKWRGKDGKAVHQVNYRHVIGSLKTKPGALLNLTYRDELFPREAYRRCFERALEQLGGRDACRLTVRLLALAHEEGCEAALADEIEACLGRGELPEPARLRTRFAPECGPMPEVAVAPASLAGYGDLLGRGDAS